LRALKSAVAALVTLAWSTAPASAQDAQAIQVTPYVALGTEAASPVGVAVTFPLTSALSVETDVAYRRGEGRIHALSSSASLLYSLAHVGEATPYLAAGIGLQQYGAPVLSPAGPPIGTQARLAMTVNAGGGLKMPIKENVGLRTDARWFKSFGEDGNEQFRVAQGISFGVKK
jgi:opacity protein-like surface antigen